MTELPEKSIKCIVYGCILKRYSLNRVECMLLRKASK